MTANELETYLVHGGYDSRIAPEVRTKVKQMSFVDLDAVPVERLGHANDTVRMDIRIVADSIYDRRKQIAKSRNLPWDSVPFRDYP